MFDLLMNLVLYVLGVFFVGFFVYMLYIGFAPARKNKSNKVKRA